MIWFVTLILYICLICAIQKRRSEDFFPTHKNITLKPPIPPLKLQNSRNRMSLPEKPADRKWLFELGF